VLLVARRMGLQTTTRPPLSQSQQALSEGAVTG
jgi:hypothetical protein